MKLARLAPLAAAALFIAGHASAAAVIPLSYDMPNGNSGSYNYWDEIYTGSGCATCDGAALSGGLGDLTDGVIAANNWYVDEAPNGNGPYVGWSTDPTITFHFAPLTMINSITIWFDDSNGAGGVSAPASFDINSVNYAVTDPAGSAPFSFTASGLGFVGDTFTLKVNRSNSWVFVSEVAFDGRAAGAVPEPASWSLMIAGFGLIGAALRRRSAVAA